MLAKIGIPETPTQSDWLLKNLPAGSNVGVDPRLYSIDEWEQLSKELSTNGSVLTAVKENLVDLIWQDRPPKPRNIVKELPLEFSGKSTKDKLVDVRKELAEANAEYLVISELDEVACLWLLKNYLKKIKMKSYLSCLILLDNMVIIFRVAELARLRYPI